jgi:hypothetical protein
MFSFLSRKRTAPHRNAPLSAESCPIARKSSLLGIRFIPSRRLTIDFPAQFNSIQFNSILLISFHSNYCCVYTSYYSVESVLLTLPKLSCLRSFCFQTLRLSFRFLPPYIHNHTQQYNLKSKRKIIQYSPFGFGILVSYSFWYTVYVVTTVCDYLLLLVTAYSTNASC